MTPWAPPLGVRIVNRPQLGGNRKSSAPLKTVALSGQKAVRSTSAARENQRPAKLGPSLRRAPGQNRTLLLLSHKQRANENNSGTPAPGPSLQPTPLQRDCSSDSLLPWEQPVEEVAKECSGGTLHGRTWGRAWSPGRKNRRIEITWLAAIRISRMPGKQCVGQ